MGSFGTGLNALYISGSNFGMGQGLNVQSIVQSLTQAAQAGETVYTDQQTLYNSQISALTNISSLLTNLQISTQTLQDPVGPLAARAATSSNSSAVTATASSGINTGNYSVTVDHLASTSTYASVSQASGADASIGTGTIQYTIGGNNYTIYVGQDQNGNSLQNNTLNSLASYINNGDYGVTASVINDANGATLALTSTTGAAAGEITGMSDNLGLNLSEAVQGLNASLKVNGVTVNSASNTVTGVIPGVTFNLLAPSASPVTISVSQDVTQATTAINDFVSAYNAVSQAVNAQFTYTQGAGSQPPLFSDASLQQIQSTLAGDINYFIKGNNGILGLSSMGVNLQQDGTISVNSTALTSALTSNAAAVETFFQGPDYVSGFAGQLYADLSTLNNSTSGVVALDKKGLNQQLTDVTNTINDFNANLLLQEQQWTNEYSQVNATLQELPLLIQQAGGQVNTSSSGG